MLVFKTVPKWLLDRLLHLTSAALDQRFFLVVAVRKLLPSLQNCYKNNNLSIQSIAYTDISKYYRENSLAEHKNGKYSDVTALQKSAIGWGWMNDRRNSAR